VSRSLGRPGNALFDLVARWHPAADEAAFVDAVGRNLRAGRFLLLVAGDGIREGTEAIVQFMHAHSGMRFAFGLVEVAGYELPDGQLLVQPRVLARTVALERTVVRVVDVAGAALADSAPAAADADDEDADAAGSPAAARRRDPVAIEADRRFWEGFARQLRLGRPLPAAAASQGLRVGALRSRRARRVDNRLPGALG
jgi:hypothetical protein